MTYLQRRLRDGWRMANDRLSDAEKLRKLVPQLKDEHFGLVEHLWDEWSGQLACVLAEINHTNVKGFARWLNEEVLAPG